MQHAFHIPVSYSKQPQLLKYPGHMYVCTPTIIIILAAHTENTVKIVQNFDGELLMNKFDEIQAKTMHPPAATYVFACKANPKFT